MRDLIYVPIEPLAERYTEQWYNHFPVFFRENGFNVLVIDGEPLQETIKVGTFLDINSTIHYKSTQLRKIAALFDSGQVKDGTRFFFGDIEFWGIESVRLMADMNQVEVKLLGFLHAGSYTYGDAFEIAAPYQKFTEVGWIASMDTVFVGSSYHKDAFITRRLVPLRQEQLANRIVVSGNPLFADSYHVFPKTEKKNQVLLTNRFDIEKNPDRSLYLFEELKDKHPDWTFIVATGRSTFTSNDSSLIDLAKNFEAKGIIEIRAGLTKEQYHKLLHESKVMVSHSEEENYGYCIAEAMFYNCQPLLTNEASHPYMVDYDEEFLFNSPMEAVNRIESLMANPFTVSHLATRFLDKPFEHFLKALK